MKPHHPLDEHQLLPPIMTQYELTRRSLELAAVSARILASKKVGLTKSRYRRSKAYQRLARGEHTTQIRYRRHCMPVRCCRAAFNFTTSSAPAAG